MGRLICLVFLLFSANSYACLNIFSVDSSGRVRFLEHDFFSAYDFGQNEIEKNINKVRRKLNRNDFSYQNISDYGAYLLISGRFKDGLDLFRTLSKKYSDIYEICANTAVAYELNGNIDSAYFWQLSAMKINPNAHRRSEWIHLKILEARKKTLSDPDWCLHNNITGIVDTVNSMKEYYDDHDHENSEGQWLFGRFLDQLDERFPFTRAEDKVMGKLMFELGDAYQYVSIYRAYYCYAIAKYLYPALSAMADKKMQEIRLKYPVNSVESNGRTIQLTGRPPANREMLPPNDEQANRLINKLVNRKPLNAIKFKPIDIEHLINKI